MTGIYCCFHCFIGDNWYYFVLFARLDLIMMEHDYAALPPKEPKTKTKSRGRQCCAFGCNNYQYNVVDGVRVPSNIHLYTFPEDRDLKNEWCRLVKRVDGLDGFHVNQSTRVCETHFFPCDFKGGIQKRLNRPTAKPVLHSWNNFTQKQPRRKLVRCDIPVTTVEEPVAAVENITEDVTSVVVGDVIESVGVAIDPVGELPEVVDFAVDRSVVGIKSADDYEQEITQLKGRIVELEFEVESLKKEKAVSGSVKEKYKEHILSNDEECAHATGFHSVTRLRQFYEFLDPGDNGENLLMARSQDKVGARRPRVLSPLEGFLLLLCRLKSGFTFKHLCFLFGVSIGAVDSHFTMWLSFVYFKVASVSWWPSKETILNNMPSSMKKKFPNTRVIIDCCEFPAENPSSLSTQKLFYSQYKGRVTIKVLVGIMPGGGFTFVSSTFPGSTSDREIVIKSGLLNTLLYEPGDAIMADRGFTIEDLVEPMGVQLIIPSFLHGRDQLSEEEIVLTQQIAAERIHVERAIQRLKTYRILHHIPVTSYDTVNQIVTVCAWLTNMQNPIISN